MEDADGIAGHGSGAVSDESDDEQLVRLERERLNTGHVGERGHGRAEGDIDDDDVEWEEANGDGHDALPEV